MDNTINIVAFGDSITLSDRETPENKWVNRVEKAINSKLSSGCVRVINSGVGGNTSREALRRLESDVVDHHPAIVLVEFGGNDSTPDPAREVSASEFTSNLGTIYARTQQIDARMLLLTFPPIVNEWHQYGDKSKYRSTQGLDQYVEQYRELTRSFARDHGLILVDLDKILRSACDSESTSRIILPDGVHLTTESNHIVANAVASELIPLIQVMLRINL